MKKLTIIMITLLWIVPNIFSQDFYDIDSINTIEIIFTEPNWDEILDSLYALGEEERLVGTAVINGVQFDSVGVRYKGSSSYNPNQLKNPLNIKLDYIIEDQILDGYGTLKLSNCFKDPSFVREVIGYEIGRKYMSASKANYINVYINGDLIGLYTNVQSVDKFFLENHFYSDDNAFFKGELEGTGIPWVIQVWGYFGPDSASYFNNYELRSEYGWSDLIEFLDIFNNNTAAVEEVLDVDRHLWMLAFDILMVNLDAPVNFGHNYYLFKDGSEQFNPIMWDLNENFGAFSMLIGGPPLNITQMQQLSPFLNISHPNYPIINRILPNPIYQKMYIAHMKTMIEENFSNAWFLNRVLEIQDLIDEYVQADPNKFYSYNNFLNNVYSPVGWGPMAIVGLTQLMDPRIAYLSNHPAFQGIPPAISDISYTPAIVSPNSILWFNATVDNTVLVELGYRQSFTNKFEKVQMFDDGNHHDGVAGDGIYGISVEAGSNNIEYYIYAENDEAVTFSPASAEYEFYTVSVTGITSDLVINEFMADNETTIADPQGEYDDWIEIYNGSSDILDLSGMYLTDDLGEPDQWAFPDTSLEPSGFLLVWADNDEGDPGLHTNFRLSANGEEIGLFMEEAGGMVLIDQVAFDLQSEDTSCGRYPDGSTIWSQLSPTPGWENAQLNPVAIVLSPSNPPVQVPGNGGSFDFNIAVSNGDSASHLVTIWCDVTLPNGTIYGPVLGPIDLTMTAGLAIDRNRIQDIPAGAPAGTYSYNAYAVAEGDTNFDSFPFEKLNTVDGGFLVDDWANTGESIDQRISGSVIEIPSEFVLFGTYPNPFNSSTIISFALPQTSHVQLAVYDIQGRKVAELVNGMTDASIHEITWDASMLSSGIYFCRIQTDDFTSVEKILLVK